MDIISDYSTRIAEAMAAGSFTPETAARIAEEVRRDWGGERAYIAKVGESAVLQITRRDIAIRREYRNGERICFLARRWQLSRRRIYQIIFGESGKVSDLP